MPTTTTYKTNQEIRAALQALPVGHVFSQYGVNYTVVVRAGQKRFQSQNGFVYQETAWNASDELDGMPEDVAPAIDPQAERFRFGVRYQSPYEEDSRKPGFALFTTEWDAVAFRNLLTEIERPSFEVVDLKTGKVVR